MNWRDHIHSDPAILSGKPVIRGTRLRVIDVFEYMAGGDTIEDMLEGWPHLTREDILACFAFAAERSYTPIQDAIAAE